MVSTSFIHLSVHSSYSLLEGMPSISALADKAVSFEMPALALTDTNNVFGAVEISKKFASKGIQPLIGCQINLATPLKTATSQYLPPAMLTLLVQNEQGWRNLLILSSSGFLDKPENEVPQVTFEKLAAHAEGLICLTGGAKFGAIAAPLLRQDEAAAKLLLTQLKNIFEDRLYVEIQRHGWKEEKETEATLLALAKEFSVPLVATNDVRYLNPEHEEAFDALLCIGQSVTIDRPDREKFTAEHYFKSANEMIALFSDLPDAVENTVHIAKRCAFLVNGVGVKDMFMPEWPIKNDKSVSDIIKEDAENGLEERLKTFVYTDDMDIAKRQEVKILYKTRLKEELDIIVPMGFAGYFLITADFIAWSKKQDIPVGPGRGSGAGSLVAWALGITDLDPIHWELYFERFLNPERISLPDFDIDFCQDRRDEVIHYVRDKYGEAYVSQIITFGTLKARACIRDVGRVLQMPYNQVGTIASFVPEGAMPPPIADVLKDDKRLKQMYEEDQEVKNLLKIAMQLEGCFRHASTHAAGVMISAKEIAMVSGLYQDPRSSMPATQLSMLDAEYAGLVKFDFLGLKTLSIIHRAVQMVQENKGVKVEILKIPLNDLKTFEMLREGHTIGVFQIESAGMTDLLKRAVPKKLTDLSDVIALYRPGPLGSGMVDDFIACRHGEQAPNYPHQVLKPVLEETFGVPVYQEQVMRMARDLAGYTLGGADMLRRAMGKKKPAEMAKHRDLFVKGAAKLHQVSSEKANEIFDLMAAFAGYGFNKAHTMAYALIAYQTAYLKANYPLEFLASSMMYDRANTAKLLKYKQDIERLEAKLLQPNVNKSEVFFKVEEEKNIRFALAAVKGAGEDVMQAIVSERKKNGDYKDIFDFLERHNPQVLNRRQMEVLIKSGALDTLHQNRAELSENLDIMISHVRLSYEERTSNQIGLFGETTTELARPVLKKTPAWDTFAQLENEQQVIGFYVSSHPMKTFTEELADISHLKPIAVLQAMAEAGRTTARVAGIILTKREMKTKRGKLMGFVTLSDASGQEEFVLFPDMYEVRSELLKSKKPIVVNLKMNMDGERLRLSAESFSSLEEIVKKKELLTLKVSDTKALIRLKEALGSQKNGQTACEILVPKGKTHVKLRLGTKIACDRHFMAQLQTVPGVEILNI